MKKLLALSPAKIFVVCGLGLLMTLGGFWHYQMNQTQLDRINILNQGVGTCFGRISQTFTAMMIRDLQSPYLHQGFMALSNECLTETINGINPFRKNVGKGYDTLNQLIAETGWFHEKIHKTNIPVISGKSDAPVNLAPIQDRFTRIENYKVSLVDEIEGTNARIREVQRNDEFLMGTGLLLFVIAVSLLSLQEFNRIQLRREIEASALSFLKSGQANVSALVDQLIDRALRTQDMPVTAQIFHDYHGSLMERMAIRSSDDSPAAPAMKSIEVAPVSEEVGIEEEMEVVRTSLKEVVVTLQNVHDNLIQVNDLRDVDVVANFETLEQILNSAVNRLSSGGAKKVMITNQVHADRTIINMFAPSGDFAAAEIEFASNDNAVAAGMDMNMMIMKELVIQEQVKWFVENKTDRSGAHTGLSMRFVINRAPKLKKNLVSVVRGRKKDIANRFLN